MKTARNKEAFDIVHKVYFWKEIFASFVCCANFIIWNSSEPWLISRMNLRILLNKFKKFLAGVYPKRYSSKIYVSITAKFINQNSTSCQIWLKKAI